MLGLSRRFVLGAAVLASLCGLPALAQAQQGTVLKAVLEAEPTIFDPHFTTAYVSRTFGYAVYDTLFALDAKGAVKPQMVDTYTVSDDKLTWTFTLRDGMLWHDGKPVTAADCVASLKRWMPKASLGRIMSNAVASIDATDARSFTIRLKEPFGLMLDVLGRPNAPVPFMIPARLAATPGSERITEVVGSGPFKFRQDLYRPGDQVVVERFKDYKPRSEPADFLAGGKVAKVDQVVFKTMPDAATAASALQTGEVDFLQYPSFDLLPVIEKNKQLKVVSFQGDQTFQGYFRINSLAKPFDDPEIRRVLWRLVDQSSVLEALGLSEQYMKKGCRSFFMCGTPYETTAGGDIGLNPSIEAAKAALKKTKYAGETIVVLQATDIDAPRVSSAVLADLLTQAGFKVDLQAMDWGTLLARRAKKDGWHVFGVHASGFDLGFPLTHLYIANNCADYAGWHCDPRLTDKLAQFAKASDETERKAIAADISKIAYEITPAVMWGQFAQPAAYRQTLTNLIPSSVPVFWNVEKKAN